MYGKAGTMTRKLAWIVAFVALAGCLGGGPNTGSSRSSLEENEEDCTTTIGYCKTHTEAWPVDSLIVGNHEYGQQELLRILWQPVRGNGLVSLAHQLIGAKLNLLAF